MERAEAGARHAVAAGVDGLEHATMLGPDGIAIPDDLIDEIAERRLTVDPTLGFDPDRVIPLDQAPNGYRDFDQGAAKKFLLDPHGLVAA